MISKAITQQKAKFDAIGDNNLNPGLLSIALGQNRMKNVSGASKLGARDQVQFPFSPWIGL